MLRADNTNDATVAELHTQMQSDTLARAETTLPSPKDLCAEAMLILIMSLTTQVANASPAARSMNTSRESVTLALQTKSKTPFESMYTQILCN